MHPSPWPPPPLRSEPYGINPPQNVYPPNIYPPPHIYPPLGLLGVLPKSVPLQPCTRKHNTNKSRVQSQHHCNGHSLEEGGDCGLLLDIRNTAGGMGHSSRSTALNDKQQRPRSTSPPKSPRREVVRSSAGAGVIYPPFFGVIRVAYPKA